VHYLLLLITAQQHKCDTYTWGRTPSTAFYHYNEKAPCGLTCPAVQNSEAGARADQVLDVARRVWGRLEKAHKEADQ
jgi:hypothetical protein